MPKNATTSQIRRLLKLLKKKIFKWFNSNILTVNTTKKVYLPFSNYANNLCQTLNELNIQQEDEEINIQGVKGTSHLDIVLDAYFRWNEDVQLLSRKLR